MEQTPDELRVKIVIPSWLQSLSNQLKALWVFFPGVIFLILGYFIFVKLSQGQDIIYQSTDKPTPWLTGIYVVMAILFWVFTTWYTARLLGYDRKDLYKEAPDLVGYFPRFLAYIIFFVLWAATLTIDGDSPVKKIIFWVAAGIDIAIFWAMHHFIETPLIKVPPGERAVRTLSAIRWAAYMVIVISCVLIIVGWGYKQVHVLLYTLPFIQVGFLYVLIIRRPLYVSRENKGRLPARTGLWGRYVHWAFKTAFDGFDFRFEKPYFITYHILALLAVLSYAMGINYLPFARGLTSFPLVMLCFGVLLGAINVISLVSHRYKINISFLILVLTLLGSWAFETHRARTMRLVDETCAGHAPRGNFRQYLTNWVSWHKNELDTAAVKSYPVFFVLADGGASRSGYWVASVLSALHEGSRYPVKRDSSYFMRHLFCLSGASGGSVGNASFLAAYAVQQKDTTGSLRTDTLSRHFLANDFLVFTLARLLGPELIKPIFGFVGSWGDRAAALEEGMEHPETGNERMGAMMRCSFLNLVPDSMNQLPLLVINSTRVNDCGPAAVSTFDIDSSKDVFGKRIDIINLLDTGDDIRLSTAMVLGARFPYLSPAGKVGTNSYFVDGGYFDNSGTGIVHEMILELQRLKDDSSLGKMVSKLDFYVMHLSNSPNPDSAKKKKDKISPVVNDLVSPILTLAGSFVSQTNINDARLTNYLKALGPDTRYVMFNLYGPEDTSSIAMDWVISDTARRKMDRALKERTGVRMLIDSMKAEGKKENLFSGLPELKNSVP